MTNRIKAASMTVYANDTQLDRVQTFGSTARLDSEDIKEIGNLDVVEVVDNVPTVDITLDANQYGSMKTLRKLVNKNFDWGTMAVTPSGTSAAISSGIYFIDEQKYVKAAASLYDLSALYPASAASSHCVATICISSAGTVTGVAGSTTGLAYDPTIPATPAGYLRLADISLKTDAASAAVNTDALHILNNHCVITTGTTGPDYLHIKDFEFAKVDFVCPIKETGDNTTTDKITRTMYITDAYANRYDAAFSVNGLSTESWSLESDNKTWFLNTGAIVYTDRFAGGTSANSFTYTAIQRDNLAYVLKAYKYNPTSGTYTDLALTTDYTATSAAITQVSATSAAAGEVLIVRYLVDPASVTDVNNAVSGQPFFKRNPSDISAHPVVAGGLRQGQVEPYLTTDGETDILGTFPANVAAVTSATRGVLRVQSVSISTSLAREALYELGHKRAYDRPLTFPIPITIQVETIASDLREFARLCGKEFATAKEMRIDQFLKNLDLVIKIYREDDIARADAGWVMKQPLKIVLVKDISVTDEAMELRVEGNGSQTFSFKANTNLIIRGRV